MSHKINRQGRIHYHKCWLQNPHEEPPCLNYLQHHPVVIHGITPSYKESVLSDLLQRDTENLKNFFLVVDAHKCQLQWVLYSYSPSRIENQFVAQRWGFRSPLLPYFRVNGPEPVWKQESSIRCRVCALITFGMQRLQAPYSAGIFFCKTCTAVLQCSIFWWILRW